MTRVFEGKYGAACYQKSAWHLQQFAHPGETWILGKFGLFRSHFVGLKSKRLDFLAIYLFGYIYIYMIIYVYIYIRIFVEARYV